MPDDSSVLGKFMLIPSYSGRARISTWRSAVALGLATFRESAQQGIRNQATLILFFCLGEAKREGHARALARGAGSNHFPASAFFTRRPACGRRVRAIRINSDACQVSLSDAQRRLHKYQSILIRYIASQYTRPTKKHANETFPKAS